MEKENSKIIIRYLKLLAGSLAITSMMHSAMSIYKRAQYDQEISSARQEGERAALQDILQNKSEFCK